MRPATTVRALVGSLTEIARMVRDPTLAVWALYLALVPVYLWASGLPQPGDILLLALAPMVLARWNGRLSTSPARTLRALLIFTAYVIVVNLTWAIVLGTWTINLKHGFGLSPLFYVYNALVFLVVLVLHRRHGERLLHLTAKIVLITLVLQVVLALGLVSGGRRATVLFNNPNQLGYYALLSASLLVILQRRRYATSLEVTIGSLAATYLALLSASKAALVGIGLLAIAGLVTRLRTMLLIAAGFGLLLVVADPMLDAVTGAISRIETDTSHGFVEERGYDRILAHPEYWVVGSGEGAYVRFEDTTTIGSHEIHSSIGTLFFSYGIVGTLLFAAFLWTVLRRSGFRTSLLVGPSLAYGLTHQGLRFTLFWVLLAIVVTLRDERAAELAARLAPR